MLDAKQVDIDLSLWPRQLDLLNTKATEILFGGATRGGKSHAARVCSIIWSLQIENLQTILIRKKKSDILENHLYGPSGYCDLLRPLEKEGVVKITQDGITFNNTSSRIVFKHCQDERQFVSAQGVASHVLIIDEATQISSWLIQIFRGWCTMPEEMKAKLPERYRGCFPKIIYTANPIGPSVPYFKRQFVKARDSFEIEKVHGFLRQFIPSRVEDNPSEDPDATKGRIEGMYDDSLAKALLEGDWDAALGDFFPEYDEFRHVIPDIELPAGWFRFRTFDWGTAEPFAVHWWAVSDGTPVTIPDGREVWFPRGAFIIYREWYGCNEDKPAEGLRLRNEDMAYGILARSTDIDRDVVTLTDRLPFQDRGGKTIAETFRDCGVRLTLADCSRIPGWSQLRSRLIGKYVDSNDPRPTPMLFIASSCKYLREYLPALPRHNTKPEDATEHGETTHVCDSARMGCMARTVIKELNEEEIAPAHYSNRYTFDDALKLVKKSRQRENGITY